MVKRYSVKLERRRGRVMTLMAVSLMVSAFVPQFLMSPVYAQGESAASSDGSSAASGGGSSEGSGKVLQAEVEEDVNGSSPATPETSPMTEAKADPNAKKLTVDDIKIEGNRLVPTEEITNVLKTKRGDTFVREQVLDDLRAINDMGYFDDKTLQVVPEMSNGGILLKIRVTENAPITQFSFQGNSVVKTEEISKIFADQLGKPQNLNQLSGAIDKVENLYHDKGFVLARVTDVKDFPDGSVSLTINEGQIDKIEIAGNRKTKDFIVRNVLKMKPGSIYNEQQLTADLRKLYANGYFQDIRRSLAPSADDPEKFALKIDVDEKRTGSVGLGGGVDSIAGPFGSLSFSDSNFRGRGQVLSFNSQMGSGVFGNFNNTINNGGTVFMPTNQRTYQVEATFIEPNLRGTNTSMAVSGFGRNFASMLIDQAQQRSLGANVNFSRPLGHNLTANLGFMGEQTMLKDLGNFLGTGSAIQNMADRALQMGQASNMANATALAERTRADQLRGGTYMTVNPTLAYDTRDEYIDPTRGAYAKLSAGPSLGLTGNSFAKLGGSVSKYVPLGKGVTLALNAQGGQAFGGIPQFAQYRLGGWNGIRGYRQFSDLGTGSQMLMATAEVRSHIPFLGDSGVGKVINKHVKAAAFFDVGRVSGNGLTNGLFNRANMGAAVGLGLRVKVPMVGLVRLDYGLPLLSSALGNFTPRFTVGFGEKF